MRLSLLTLVLLLATSQNDCRQLKSVIEDLGTLGGDSSFALGINSTGSVTGASYKTPTGLHAFRYVDGLGMIDVGAFPSANLSEGQGISDRGHIAGGSFVAAAGDVNVNAFVASPTLNLTDIGSVDRYSYAWDVNDSGHVTGEFDNDLLQTHAFLWTRDNGMRDLGTLGGSRSVGRSINEVGQIAGDSATRNDSTTHAFRFTPGQGMRDLGTLGGRKSSAYGINNLGEVVGESDFQLVNNPSTTAFILPGTSLTGTHAFLWTEAKGMKDLGHLGGGYSIAQAINNNGEVVGYSTLPGGTRRAFRWSSFGGMKDLNTLLPSGSGWVLTEANDINDRGQVVGNGLHNGKSRAFRFTLPTATVLQADFDSDTFGPPKPAQKVGTVWVEPVDGTVSVIDAPMPDAPNKHWVRIGSPTVRSSLKGEFAGFNGDGSGNYTLTATMFIRNGTDTVTLQFEPGAFGPLSYLHFLHLDFTPQGDVQIDDGPKFGNYPKDLPFQIRVNLVINGGAAGIARISLSGGGASGNTEYTLPNQSLTFGRRFGAIRFWMIDGPGEFFVDNIVVTRRDL